MNNAIAAVEQIEENRGKLGVFWHTQGSGKSNSMVFFSQKVLRTIPGNWTFVIITDRKDLNWQIYRNVANTGALLEDEKRVRADSAVSLKRMLNGEDHRYVFTLIQKFRTARGYSQESFIGRTSACSNGVGQYHRKHGAANRPSPGNISLSELFRGLG